MLVQTSAELNSRYAALAAARRSRGTPVYAIEHGLTQERVQSLRAAADRQFRISGLRRSEWLVWVVLAAEAGYGYTGEEYWPHLAEVAGEWRGNGDRETLRGWFSEFRRQFGGPLPVGRWASHFSIIAWPIANAILPKYLQALFVRYLFDVRYELAREAATNPNSVGAFLKTAYAGGSSRLSDFLEQEELTTQIVLALRDDDQVGAEERISEGSLTRIVTDLGHRQLARDFLRETRTVMRDGRVRFKAAPGGVAPASVNSLSSSIAPLRLAARLVSGNRLALGLIIPKFGAIFGAANKSVDILDGARVRFAGKGERWSPGKVLLSWAGRDRAINEFPRELAPAIELNGVDKPLEDLLGPYLRLGERPCWVLRQHADALYREVLGGHIRAGESYVVISRAKIPDAIVARARLVSLESGDLGVFSFALVSGQQIDQAQRAALAELGVAVVADVILEPAALAPRLDPSGLPTWLSTEIVAFSCKAEFPMATFTIQLNGGQAVALESPTGELLLSLGHLAAGNHKLIVSAKSAGGDDSGISPAHYEFSVTAPRPWQEQMQRRSGFRIIATPPKPSLEDLLAGRTRLQILGPTGRSVAWSLETADASGHQSSVSTALIVPVSASADQVGSILSRLATAQSAQIEIAHRVDIVAAIDELGRQFLQFPHIVQPLRWAYDTTTGKVRLIDETAHENPIIVNIYSLAAPLRAKSLAPAIAVSGVGVESPGALYVARHMRKRYCLFVSNPPSGRLASLADLGLAQSLEHGQQAPAFLRSLIRGLRLWQGTRSVGPLALVRKSSTLDRLENAIAELCCGRDFAERLRPGNVASLLEAQQMIGGSPGFGVRMRTSAWSRNPDIVAQQLARYAKIYRIELDEAICRDAVYLAFKPIAVRLTTPEEDSVRLGAMLKRRNLLRGAFLAKAAANAQPILISGNVA